MRGAVLAALIAAAPLRPAAAGKAAGRAAAGPTAMTDAEREYCASELEMVANRRKIFEAQGLPAGEIARRNASAEQGVADCRKRYRQDARRDAELAADQAELARRLPPNATPLERERLWHEIRRDRLAAKSPSSLTASEKAELAAGLGDEEAETQATLDLVHSRDAAFMRQVNSALACYHSDRRDALRADIDEESAHVKLGTGDRQRLYALQSDLSQSDAVLARAREAARSYPGGLMGCSDTRTAILARCLAIRFEGKPREPACDAEEIQQYLRFIK